MPLLIAVLWIRIHMFWGLPDSDPSLFTDPDPSINKQKNYEKVWISTIFLLLLDFFSLKT